MAKYDVKLLKKLAKKEALELKLRFFETELKNFYDFNVTGNTNVWRFEIVANKRGKNLFPSIANVYIGTSSKFNIQFNSYKDLILKIKFFC